MIGDGGDLGTIARDEVTGKIIEAIIKVHRILGPGFLESVYRRALIVELTKQRIATASEVAVDIS